MIRLALAGVAMSALLGSLVVVKSIEERGLRKVIAAARACDQALTEADRFDQSLTCSPAVLTLVAQRDTAQSQMAALNDELLKTRADQADALARAEARGRTQTQRTQSVQTRLDAAPRTDSGLGRCDADCLSRLGRD
ncbi:hypothetical protein JIP62_06275 [Brevundimonas vitis]|uniref:Uncharacterized protein n=1 Tax=Brevundimonas vitisensis TaxID=2800818 RepID=A0ABX7BQG0_9CAUL|nr:hypothetical protein [Brevundimonas vitisensis]QQQ19690.1 hypothetical protein JIP62_06275 [Brevundimonas vitisensis]